MNLYVVRLLGVLVRSRRCLRLFLLLECPDMKIDRIEAICSMKVDRSLSEDSQLSTFNSLTPQRSIEVLVYNYSWRLWNIRRC